MIKMDSGFYFQVVKEDPEEMIAFGPEFESLTLAVASLPHVVNDHLGPKPRSYEPRPRGFRISCYFRASLDHGSVWVADYTSYGVVREASYNIHT
jgi:hypothetical protein